MKRFKMLLYEVIIVIKLTCKHIYEAIVRRSKRSILHRWKQQQFLFDYSLFCVSDRFWKSKRYCERFILLAGLATPGTRYFLPEKN